MTTSYTSTQIIAKEGWRLSLIAFVAFVVSLWLNVWPWVFLFVLGVVLYVYRNPERIAEEEDGLALLSPADGRVGKIEKGLNSHNEPCLKVAIEGGLLCVGMLRAPLALEVEKIAQTHGLSLPSNSSKAPSLNEQRLLTCKHTHAVFEMRVVAGLLAQTITLFSAKKKYRSGERMGFVADGMVELYLPLDARIRVTVGQRIYAGQTVLGYLKGA